MCSFLSGSERALMNRLDIFDNVASRDINFPAYVSYYSYFEISLCH
jgi:hypothetical protein